MNVNMYVMSNRMKDSFIDCHASHATLTLLLTCLIF